MKQQVNQRIRADFLTAAALLADPQLLWSADFDAIRQDLAKYLESKAGLGAGNHPNLIAVVDRLIQTEYDLSIGE